MKSYKIFFLTGLLFASQHLYAKQFEYTGNCRIRGGDMLEFEHCLDTELAYYDNQLNNLYRTFFRNKQDNRLKRAEMAWVQFKETDCGYMAYEVNEGREYPSIFKACRISRTKARIADLKRSFSYSDWFEKGR